MAANVGGRSVGGGGDGAGGTGGGVTACRASGSRWTPTPEQIKILKELYYGCGIRSPNSEQIQRITAMLRQHGKIEGKNVFYWFHNHKARERQKRRLTNLDVNVPAAGAAASHLGVLSLSSPSGTRALFSSACTAISRPSIWRARSKRVISRSCIWASNHHQARRLPPPPWACTPAMAAARRCCWTQVLVPIGAAPAPPWPLSHASCRYAIALVHVSTRPSTRSCQSVSLHC
jgi:hypothetical protein